MNIEIIVSSKPISYKIFKDSVNQDIMKKISDHFDSPIAIIKDDEVEFYICNSRVLQRLYGNFSIFNDIKQRLTINNSDFFLSLHAIEKLIKENKKRYYEIVEEMKKDVLVIDKLDDLFKSDDGKSV